MIGLLYFVAICLLLLACIGMLVRFIIDLFKPKALIDPELKEVLQKMWELKDVSMTKIEKEFFNNNLPLIREYYTHNSIIWRNIKSK